MSERTPPLIPDHADPEMGSVTEAERAAAAALAGALEGQPGEGPAAGEAELAQAIKEALRGAAAGAGQAATARVLADVLGPAPDRSAAPVDDLEVARAARLGGAVDRLVAGLPPAGPAPAGTEELLRVAVMVQAGAHAVPLASGRLEDLEDAALGTGAPARATPRLRRWAVGLAVAAGLALALGTGLYLAADQGPAAPPAAPAHLTSRSTRDVLPEAFPADQTASSRIDLVYQSRLGAYREVLLDGRAARPRGGRR